MVQPCVNAEDCTDIHPLIYGDWCVEAEIEDDGWVTISLLGS